MALGTATQLVLYRGYMADRQGVDAAPSGLRALAAVVRQSGDPTIVSPQLSLDIVNVQYDFVTAILR